MAYDEFITDGDKPYAENLNDSLLLLDAFDVTVPLEMPGMFTNGDFNSTLNVARKCGVGIVTLMSVDEGVSVGTDSISGTGDVVFRIYPNFNSFYKWQSIVLEKTGDVEISFKKIDGTGISATINSEGVISEASALKELQEIDVCFSLDEAEITNILICFVNNQTVHTRVNALLEADQLIHVNGTVSENDDKAVSGDTVYNAIDSLSDTVDGKLDLKEDLSNKVSTLNTSTTNYPTCKAVKDKLDLKSDTGHTHTISNVTNLQSTLNNKAEESDLLDLIYPVGSIYMEKSTSFHDVCPIQQTLGGEWTRIENKFLYASENGQGLGQTGGEEMHTLTTNEMPNHTHLQNPHQHGLNRNWSTGTGRYSAYTQSADRSYQSINTTPTTAINQSTGGGQPHNNMPPYIIVNVWERTG